MPYGVGKSSFFTVEDIKGKIRTLESVPEQIFSFSVGIKLLLRIDRHDIFYERQITERYTGF